MKKSYVCRAEIKLIVMDSKRVDSIREVFMQEGWKFEGGRSLEGRAFWGSGEK